MISPPAKSSEQERLAPVIVAPVPPRPVTDPGNDPEQIRAEMARTRVQMGMTIDALQERLDPQRLKEEATEKAGEVAMRVKVQVAKKVREATIDKVEGKVEEMVNTVKDTADEARYGLADTIRANPIPAALVGIGLAAMFFKGSDRSGRRGRPNGHYATRPGALSPGIYGGMTTPQVRSGPLMGDLLQDTTHNVADQTISKVQDAGQGAQQLGRQARDQVGNMTGQVKDTVHQLGDQAQDQVENLAGQVKGSVQQLGSQAQDLTGQVKDSVHYIGAQAHDQAGELSDNVQDQVETLTSEIVLQAQRLSGTFNRMLHENPLSLGVVAIALGAAAAMLAPQTDKEDQLFGDAQEQVLQKAQVAAHQALDQVQQKVTEQAQQLASTSAR